MRLTKILCEYRKGENREKWHTVDLTDIIRVTIIVCSLKIKVLTLILVHRVWIANIFLYQSFLSMAGTLL